MAQKQYELTWVDPLRMTLLFIPFAVVGAIGFLIHMSIIQKFFMGLFLFPVVLLVLCVISAVQGWFYAFWLNLVMRVFQKGPIFEADEVSEDSEEDRVRMMFERR